MAKNTKAIAGKASASAEERIYTIPLRKAWLSTPRNKRAKRSVNTIRLFLKKHMHSDVVKISSGLNEHLWYRGIEKPPGKVKIKARKNKEGLVWARLPNELDIQDKGKDKGRMSKLKERVAGTPLEKKVEQMEKAKEKKDLSKGESEVEKKENAHKEEAKPKEEPKNKETSSKKEKKPIKKK
ncbi:MAG: 50S ribosomal protein L31e [Nanoarchaeota archaeon]|nr:50S ribosomal protein L31e [Nanoarchaeota archaeon]MBU1135726.1 50S ribosomal protein L31e [Nanoarchaeota archaeon]